SYDRLCSAPERFCPGVIARLPGLLNYPVPCRGRIRGATAARHELTSRLSQQAAARHPQLSSARFDRFKQLVGEGDGGFHDPSITGNTGAPQPPGVETVIPKAGGER